MWRWCPLPGQLDLLSFFVLQLNSESESGGKRGTFYWRWTRYSPCSSLRSQRFYVSLELLSFFFFFFWQRSASSQLESLTSLSASWVDYLRRFRIFLRDYKLTYRWTLTRRHRRVGKHRTVIKLNHRLWAVIIREAGCSCEIISDRCR